MNRLDSANRLLASHKYGTVEHERGLDLLLQEANDSASAQPAWFLGAYFLQVRSREGALREAEKWLRRAAEQGHSAAIDRLADLCVLQSCDKDSLPEADMLYRHLGDRGHAPALWQAAYLRSCPGRAGSLVDSAGSLFLRACALAYPPAYYSLGLRFCAGNGVRKDLDFGRALLLRAADGGYRGADQAAAELALSPEVAGRDAYWYEKLKTNLDRAQPLLASLRRADASLGAPVDRIVLELEGHLAAIGHEALTLDASGRACVSPEDSYSAPFQSLLWMWRSSRPKVGICHDFASREECDHLVNKVAGSLVDPEGYRTFRSSNDDAEIESFSGTGKPIGPLHTDAVTRMLEIRMAIISNWTMEAMEPNSIIRYKEGDEYRPHVDFFTREQIESYRNERGDRGGQRIATCLVYLIPPDAGGETEYPAAGLLVKGSRGTAVIHYNADKHGRPDEESLHIGRPILSGEKWIWRCALREKPIHA